jgi:hypothetical protein
MSVGGILSMRLEDIPAEAYAELRGLILPWLIPLEATSQL